MMQFDRKYYDENYFAKEGKPYKTIGGKTYFWGYNNISGEWTGCIPIMYAIKSIFYPKLMISVGEGRGTFVQYARWAGIKAYGFDFSEWALKHPYDESGKYLFLASAKNIPLKDQCSDFTFVSDLMEHIYIEDLEDVINEINRISSRFIFYNIGGTNVSPKDAYCLSKTEQVPRHLEGLAVAGHVTCQPTRWWQRKLNNENFVFRGDLVKQFRNLVNQVSVDVLQNWKCILILEKLNE